MLEESSKIFVVQFFQVKQVGASELLVGRRKDEVDKVHDWAAVADQLVVNRDYFGDYAVLEENKDKLD